MEKKQPTGKPSGNAHQRRKALRRAAGKHLKPKDK